MDDQAFELLMNRMDRIENKVDQLLEFKWKAAGGMFVIMLIFEGLKTYFIHGG